MNQEVAAAVVDPLEQEAVQEYTDIEKVITTVTEVVYLRHTNTLYIPSYTHNILCDIRIHVLVIF